MVKKYMLIAVIAFSSVQGSFATPWMNFFRSAANRIQSTNTFNVVTGQWDKAKSRVQEVSVKHPIFKKILRGIVPVGSLIFAFVKTGIYPDQTVEEYLMTLKISKNDVIDLKKDDRYKESIMHILRSYAKDNEDITFYGINHPDKTLASANLSSKAVLVNGVIMTHINNNNNAIYVIIGHEIGHIILHDHVRPIYLHNTLNIATTFGLGTLLALSKRSFLYAIPAAIGKYYVDRVLYMAYSRHCEREADAFARNYAWYPGYLRNMAEQHKAWNVEPKNVIDYYVNFTHPSSTERAEFFEKGADYLEKKLENLNEEDEYSYLLRKRVNRSYQPLPAIKQLQDDSIYWEKSVFAKAADELETRIKEQQK